MRIISGKFKNKKLLLPDDKLTRPLRDLVKESIFNILEHSLFSNINIKNSNILDLFSGTGSFGLEAISRGARFVKFVENYNNALKILEKNISNLKCENFCEIVKLNCFDYIKNKTADEQKYDIIFLDPPFKEKMINELLEKLILLNNLKNNGIVILHRHKKDNLILTEKIKILDKREYGLSKIIFAKF